MQTTLWKNSVIKLSKIDFYLSMSTDLIGEYFSSSILSVPHFLHSLKYKIIDILSAWYNCEAIAN